MMDDERLAANPLLRVLYEVDADNNTTVLNVESVEMSSTMWRFQERITLQNITGKLNEMPNQTQASGDANKPHELLQLFFKEVNDKWSTRLTTLVEGYFVF